MTQDKRDHTQTIQCYHPEKGYSMYRVGCYGKSKTCARLRVRQRNWESRERCRLCGENVLLSTPPKLPNEQFRIPLSLVSGRTLSTGRDGVPNRPDAQRPQAERPRPAHPLVGRFGAVGGGVGAGGPGLEGAGLGTLFGGQVHFQAGLGFFPSLFGLQFVSIARLSCRRDCYWDCCVSDANDE